MRLVGPVVFFPGVVSIIGFFLTSLPGVAPPVPVCIIGFFMTSLLPVVFFPVVFFPVVEEAGLFLTLLLLGAVLVLSVFSGVVKPSRLVTLTLSSSSEEEEEDDESSIAASIPLKALLSLLLLVLRPCLPGIR